MSVETPSCKGNPRVFISYSHDSADHAAQVLALSDRLRSEGIDCVIDQYEPAPPEGWPSWMEAQVKASDFVLLVCTEGYYQRATTREKASGVLFESVIITQDLYSAAMRNERFIPILFDGSSPREIIEPLRSFTYYSVDSEQGYEGLYRRLTDQPRIEKPDLGRLRRLPALEPRITFPRPVATDAAAPAIPQPASEAQDPQFPNERIEELSRSLEKAYRKLEDLESREQDSRALRKEIVTLKRLLREDGLNPGDFLMDGRFKLVAPIGQGGFAKVWKAYDRKELQLVAIKVLHGEHTDDRTRRERFFRGARKMAELQHENVVRVVGQSPSNRFFPFFVMEYVAGGDLRQAVLKERISKEDGLRIVLEVGDALAFAHHKGVIHRDVKPANILLDSDGRPKLTDFDLVRASDTTGGTRTGMLGTVIYTAPEVMERAQDADERADVYSLGMTAIFTLLGEDLPLEALRHVSILIDQVTDKAFKSFQTATSVKEALRRAVAWKAEDRYPAVASFCSRLKDAIPRPMEDLKQSGRLKDAVPRPTEDPRQPGRKDAIPRPMEDLKQSGRLKDAVPRPMEDPKQSGSESSRVKQRELLIQWALENVRDRLRNKPWGKRRD